MKRKVRKDGSSVIVMLPAEVLNKLDESIVYKEKDSIDVNT